MMEHFLRTIKNTFESTVVCYTHDNRLMQISQITSELAIL